MKYSRLGRRYSCSSCCWPLTFLFLLAMSVFHVTATTAAIKYNYQQQTKQLQLQPQSERQQRQQLLQEHNQQSTYKDVESSNENNTAETISGTILQSAMVIIDDNFDDYNSQRKNKTESKYSNSEQNGYRKSNKKSNERTTDFPKAKAVEAITPTMTNIPMVKAASNETMKLPTAITPKPISEVNSVMPTATTSTTTTKAPITTAKTAATTKFVVKIVSETATTTKMLRATATMKLLPPIAKAYGKIKMSSLEKPKKDTDKNDDNADDDDSISTSKSRARTNRSSSKSEKASLSKNNRSTDIKNSTMLLYQQQSSTSEQASLQQQLQKQQETQTVQDEKRQTTSLANVTPLVVINRGTTPSALLRLMSEEQQNQGQQHFVSLYAPPLSHTIAYRRERRQEPAAEEQVDKCRTFLESDDNKNVINSPDYPNDYPKNINCTRVIVAPKGQIIRLDFRNSFHIEDKEECKFDYLEIRDGQYGFSNLIGKYCGTDFPPEITSKERYLWLHFHSDESIEYSGFTAVYEFMDRSRETPSTDLNCTIEKSGVEGWVNSSDIPEDIKKTAEDNKIPLDCMWRIQVNDTWKIQIKFLEFKLVRPNDCEGNFLDIFPEETTMPRRVKNFCGSAGEGIGSETNIIHIRFYAEPSTINSTFGILYTAFRERGSAKTCNEGELDCQDSTCISETLMCNERDNCKFRWDEEPCKKNKKQESSEILIIIIVFGLILGGMILTFLVNCIRKIMRDQKIIREHIRQSKESKLDQLSRHSKGRSRDNISMAMSPRQKHSETSLHILDDVSQRDYYGVAEISVHSNKTLDIRDKEQLQQQQHRQQIERERSREREREHIIMRHDMVVQTSLCEGDSNNDDGDSMATGNDLVTPAAPAYRSDMGCQTRESLFATPLVRQKSMASSDGGSAVIAPSTTPQPNFSTFGYDTASSGAPTKPKVQAATLRHSIRVPLQQQRQQATSSIAGSIDSEKVQTAPMRSHETCHHHYRHHMPSEQGLEQSQEPRYHTQIYAQAQPLTSHQHPPYPHHSHHQHHLHQHQHQHQQTSTLPHQHKTKVIIPPLIPVSMPTPMPATPNVFSETTKHSLATTGTTTTKPQKQKSDDSKGYIDRNSAPDVIIMTSH